MLNRMLILIISYTVTTSLSYAHYDCDNSNVSIKNIEPNSVVQFVKESCQCPGINIDSSGTIKSNEVVQGSATPNETIGDNCSDQPSYGCTFKGQLIAQPTNEILREFTTWIYGYGGSGGGNCNPSGWIQTKDGSQENFPSDWIQDGNQGNSSVQVLICNNSNMTECEDE